MIDLDKVRELGLLHHPEEIARIMGVNINTLKYQIKINNITTKVGINIITPEIGDKIRSMINDGMYLTQISKNTQISTSTIRYWLKRNNIKIINGINVCRLTSFQQSEIIRLASEGNPGSRIAKMLGIGKEGVFRYCKNNNIELTPGTYRKYTLNDVTLMVNPMMELTGNEDKGKYEVRCKIHKDIIRKRNTSDLYQGCPICINNGNSRQQSEILTFMSQFNPIDRYKITTRKEIDIYIPHFNLGIEYCGLYWHSDATSKSAKTQHFDKYILSSQKGIRLITIFEDEWLNKTEQVKGYLMSIVNINKKIFARHCTVNNIQLDEAKLFLNEHHIQGAARSSIVAFGIYHESILVGVMTGGRHIRGSNDALILDRMCFKYGLTIVGGASRMFRKLKDYAIHNKYTAIISWSDNRWSDGNVYQKIGFTLDAELPPDYSYTKNRTRFSKQSKKKAQLIKEGGAGNTEAELARSLGYSRIYDCGKKRWKLSL